MKSYKIQLICLCTIVLGVIAWAPSNNDDIVMGSNIVTSPNGYVGVIGINNPVNANHSLVIGTSNTLRGSSVGASADSSTAIGLYNLVTSTHGWAMGAANEVTGLRGVGIGSNNQAKALESVALGSSNIIDSTAQYSYALGGGLRVNQGGAIALGSWNAPMVAGDKLVIGYGEMATPATSFRATSDGSIVLGSPTGNGKVVLAKAQGDISMGAYQ